MKKLKNALEHGWYLGWRITLFVLAIVGPLALIIPPPEMSLVITLPLITGWIGFMFGAMLEL